MDFYEACYLPDPETRSDPRAAPLLAPDLSGAPPAYVAVCGFDPLRDEGIAYAERLGEAGVPVELRAHRGLVHGFAPAAGIGHVAPAAMREVAAAIRAALAERA
jgi:acetyl esterase